MSRRRALVPFVLIAAGLVALGCADSGDDAATTGDKVDGADSKFVDETGSDTVAVAVPDNSFEPPYLEVSPGTKVRWTNDGRNPHNVQPAEPGAFEGVATDDFAPGQSYSVTFDDAGDYPYYCSIHGTKKLSGQSGVIRVVDGGS